MYNFSSNIFPSTLVFCADVVCSSLGLNELPRAVICNVVHYNLSARLKMAGHLLVAYHYTIGT
jgi:hypothetical protein